MNKMISLVAAVGAASLLATSAHAQVGSVRVECYGDCNLVTLGQVCNSYRWGSEPIAVSCTRPASVGQGTAWACGYGVGWCIEWGTMLGSDPLGAYCDDIDGIDSVVACTTGSFSLAAARQTRKHAPKLER